MDYPINEVFETLQGEGVFTGCPAIFVRLQQCPVGCPWCDTRHTWGLAQEDRSTLAQVISKTAESPLWCQVTESELIALFVEQGFTAKHLVITGGEPCLHDLTPLCLAAEAAGFQVQIETSGTHRIQVTETTWVTVSPKINMPGGLTVLPDAMLRANEIKHPVGTEKDIEKLDNLLGKTRQRDDVIISLQPLSQGRYATKLAIKACIQRNWRLSMQTHKYLGIE